MTRGRYMKTFVAFLDARDPLVAPRVHARVPAELRHHVSATTALGWMPAEVNTEYTRAVYDQLGEPAAESFFHDIVLESMKTPLFEGMATAFIRLVGLDPAALARGVGKITNVMFKDAGTWTVADRTSRGALVRVENAPPLMLEDPWPRSARASVSAVFHIARKPAGTCKLARIDHQRGLIEFELRW